ncbi:MAG: iron-sulfur cluster assembly accessory protein [Acidobacteria bacterium]|nr:iron-sulfur cluster assembly accessory protein [Acidobacteriota bacterium]
MAIEVTPRAAEQIKELMKKQNMTEGGLRVAVRGGGCSGLMYEIELESQQRPGDQVFETNGAKVFCDLKSCVHLNNLVLDYSEGLMSKGFVFNNPNASHTCGCGLSFS